MSEDQRAERARAFMDQVKSRMAEKKAEIEERKKTQAEERAEMVRGLIEKARTGLLSGETMMGSLRQSIDDAIQSFNSGQNQQPRSGDDSGFRSRIGTSVKSSVMMGLQITRK